MSFELFKRATEIFAEVIELAPPERAAFLDDACADDPLLRSEVESLLRQHEKAEAQEVDAVAQPALEPGGGLEMFETHSVSPLPTSSPESIGPTHIGPYSVLSQLGEGGMGTVYLAEQSEPVRRRVALKIIKRGMDSREVVARFEAERQALAVMSHPHIARIHDAGTTPATDPGGGRPYFVMELVPGLPITEYCDNERLDLAARLRLFLQICGAVGHAHQRGIIHRDIKPSNILVSTHDGIPVAKVIDFGIAKATHNRLTEKTIYTQLGSAIGTPAYMSPEQAGITGDDLDIRTDIYSLGVVLYELMVGETPLDLESTPSPHEQILARIREEEPPPPSTRWRRLNRDTTTKLAERRGLDFAVVWRKLRGDLDWIVMKSLEKNRDRRYPSAAHLAEDIERHLRDEPVLARPPSALYRASKFLRKNRARVAAVMGATVILVLLVTAGWLASKAERDARALKERDYGPRVIEAIGNVQFGRLAGSPTRGRTGFYDFHRRRMRGIAKGTGLSPVGAAINELDEAVTMLPERLDAYWYRAQARQILGDEKSARADLQRTMEITPDFLPGLVALVDLLERSDESEPLESRRARIDSLAAAGWAHHWLAARRAVKKQLWNEAAEEFGKAIEAGRDAEPYLGWGLQTRLERAMVLIASRRPDKALMEIAVVRDKWPDAIEAALLEGEAYDLLGALGHNLSTVDEREHADRLFEKLFEGAEHKDDLALEIASRYHHSPEPDYEKALAWIERIRDERVRERFRSPILFLLGHTEEGLRAGRRAVELEPNNGESHGFLAHGLLNFIPTREAREEAVEHLKTAIALEPEALVHRLVLAIGYARLSDVAEIEHEKAALKKKALAACEEVLRRKPPAWYFTVLGVVYSTVATSEAETNRARECHDKAAELVPGNPHVHNNRATFLTGIGEFRAAVEACDRALEIDENFSWPRANKASVLEDLAKEAEDGGDEQESSVLFQSAIEEYRQATRGMPRYTVPHNRLGRLLLERGDLPGAFQATAGALDVRIGAPVAHARLRKIFLEHEAEVRDEAEDLRRVLQAAVDAGNTDEEVRKTLELISGAGSR